MGHNWIGWSSVRRSSREKMASKMPPPEVLDSDLIKEKISEELRKRGIPFNIDYSIIGSSSVYHQVNFLINTRKGPLAVIILDGELTVKKALAISVKKIDTGIDYVVMVKKAPEECKFLLSESGVSVIENYDVSKLLQMVEERNS